MVNGKRVAIVVERVKGLWQVDGTLPNLALMKLSSWLRSLDFVPVLQRVPDRFTAYASVIFTENRPRVEMWRRVYDFEVGGSGWDLAGRLPDEVEGCVPDYSLYGIGYAMGRLSVGCIRDCSFCIVRRKEGGLRQVAQLGDLVRPDSRKLMLLDNNLLALPGVVGILEEMIDLGLRVAFTQGLDIRLVTPEIAELLAGVDYRANDFKHKRLFFAFDDIGLEERVRAGIDLLLGAGLDPDTLSFYVLVGYDSDFGSDVARCEILRGYGIKPYVMRYRKAPDLNALARWANASRGLWRMPFSEYTRTERVKVGEGQGCLFSIDV